jgi:hypothetical protein
MLNIDDCEYSFVFNFPSSTVSNTLNTNSPKIINALNSYSSPMNDVNVNE